MKYSLRKWVLPGVAAIALATGCGPRLVTEAEMKDRAILTQVAGDVVQTPKHENAKVKRVAIIGASAGRSTNQTRSRWDFNGIFKTVSAVQDLSDAAKGIACRALEGVFHSLGPALEASGFQPVAATEKLNADPYRTLAESGAGGLICVSPRAQVILAFKGLGALFGGGPAKVHEMMLTVGKLMDDLGVDGLLTVSLQSDQLKASDSSLILFTKNPDGTAHESWIGHIKKDKVEFEAATKAGGDDGKVQNITRVYDHTFRLLAAKLAADGAK